MGEWVWKSRVKRELEYFFTLGQLPFSKHGDRATRERSLGLAQELPGAIAAMTLPPPEAEILTATTRNAADVARHHRPAAGCSVLSSGLQRARHLAQAGERWGAELVLQWEAALDEVNPSRETHMPQSEQAASGVSNSVGGR